MKDSEYILQHDIVIPKGTLFENWESKAKEMGYHECVVGIGDNHTEFFKIKMQDALVAAPGWFVEKDENQKK